MKFLGEDVSACEASTRNFGANFGANVGEIFGNFVSNFASFFGNLVQQKGGAKKTHQNTPHQKPRILRFPHVHSGFNFCSSSNQKAVFEGVPLVRHALEILTGSATSPSVANMTNMNIPTNRLLGVHEFNVLSISQAWHLKRSSNPFRAILAQISTSQLMRNTSWEVPGNI